MFRIIVLVVSLAAGGGAAWLTLGTQSEAVHIAATAAPAAEPKAAPQAELEEVLVAAIDLDQRKKLIGEDVHWQPWPEEAVSSSYITRSAQPDALESMVGTVVRSQILAGEPIRQEKLAGAGTGFLSSILPTGKRAVAVRVSAETTAGGFILPDDRVDVLHTTAPVNQADGESGGISRTILTNIRVLAVDQQVGSAETESVAVGETATLELDAVQAETVSAAVASGTLSLALRSAADNGEAPRIAQNTTGRTVRIISAGRSEIVKTK